MPLPPPSPDATCLLTGASAGLGSELARGLARRGRNVTLVARRAGRLEDLAAELSATHGVRADVAPCDLGDPARRAAVVDGIGERGLRVDVLVNAAGITTLGQASDATLERDLALARVNVEAVVDLTVRIAGAMARRGAGGILNLASTAAFAPVPNQAAYAASKAFVLSYTDAIGAELASSGVHVTALCPGPTPTEIFDAAGGTNPVDRLPGVFWHPVAEVAEAGLDALESGRARAFAGAANRLSALAGQHTPRSRRALGLAARFFTSPEQPHPARR